MHNAQNQIYNCCDAPIIPPPLSTRKNVLLERMFSQIVFLSYFLNAKREYYQSLGSAVAKTKILSLSLSLPSHLKFKPFMSIDFIQSVLKMSKIKRKSIFERKIFSVW